MRVNVFQGSLAAGFVQVSPSTAQGATWVCTPVAVSRNVFSGQSEYFVVITHFLFVLFYLYLTRQITVNKENKFLRANKIRKVIIKADHCK